MENNTCILYYGLTEVYEKLIEFCTAKGFKVKESNEKYYYLRARKASLLFWRSLKMEIEIQAIEKEKVQVSFLLFRVGKRQIALEKEYMNAFGQFL